MRTRATFDTLAATDPSEESDVVEFKSYPPGTPSWVDLSSPDLAGAKAFYGALFGWEATEGSPESGGYCMFQKGGKNVAGLGPVMDPGQPPSWMTYVSVRDADATVAKVNAAGGTVVVAPMDVLDVGRMAVFIDPTGSAPGAVAARHPHRRRARQRARHLHLERVADP